MRDNRFMKRGLSNLRVLLADPSSHMAGLIATMLRTCRVTQVDVASTAERLQAALRQRAYDILMLDDRIPGIDCVQLVKDLRLSPQAPNRSAAIIMMSALPDSREIAAARDAGVTEFLRKPFSAQHIESRLLSIRNTPRVFVDTGAYAGPDRRRRDLPASTGRRASDTGKAKSA